MCTRAPGHCTAHCCGPVLALLSAWTPEVYCPALYCRAPGGVLPQCARAPCELGDELHAEALVERKALDQLAAPAGAREQARAYVASCTGSCTRVHEAQNRLPPLHKPGTNRVCPHAGFAELLHIPWGLEHSLPYPAMPCSLDATILRLEHHPCGGGGHTDLHLGLQPHVEELRQYRGGVRAVHWTRQLPGLRDTLRCNCNPAASKSPVAILTVTRGTKSAKRFPPRCLIWLGSVEQAGRHSSRKQLGLISAQSEGNEHAETSSLPLQPRGQHTHLAQSTAPRAGACSWSRRRGPCGPAQRRPVTCQQEPQAEETPTKTQRDAKCAPSGSGTAHPHAHGSFS